MNSLMITSFVAAALAAVMLPLTIQVSMRRVALGKAMGDLAGVAFGDGGDEVLRRRIRAFGNFAEYAPMGLVLLALLETGGAPASWTWAAGVSLLVGRIAHATGMLTSTRPTLRVVGMTLTYVALGIPAVWFVVRAAG